jgi:hypothetical protein
MSTATMPIRATKYFITKTIKLGMSFILPLAIGLQIVESVPQEAAEETLVDGLIALTEPKFVALLPALFMLPP